MFTFYEVGGRVRDEILNIQSKDIDYVAVKEGVIRGVDIHNAYRDLKGFLMLEGFKIYKESPENYTIRAKFPDGHENEGIDADFVLARKELGYIKGTRQPIVIPGSLYDDLRRRDFTVNAIAKTTEGKYIDPFNGQADIKNRVLQTPISGFITFADDPLRLLRAIRFAITKNMTIHKDIVEILNDFDYDNDFKAVSEERIREELHKMFKYNTYRTLLYLENYNMLRRYIFKNTKLWLEPTNKK